MYFRVFLKIYILLLAKNKSSYGTKKICIQKLLRKRQFALRFPPPSNIPLFVHSTNFYATLKACKCCLLSDVFSFGIKIWW